MMLNNQKVVVIGGSSGMGLAAAKRCASEGAQVTIASRNREKLARAAGQIGPDCRQAVLDMTDEKAVEALFSGFAGLDHLLLVGAGRPAWGSLREVTTEALMSAFQTKLLGYFLCAKHAAPIMSANGSILFTIGGAARAAIPGTAGLAAVNGGIVAMARTLAKELAPLRVNVISPGLVDTPAYAWMGEEDRKGFYQKMGASLPVGRIGSADDIAAMMIAIICNGFMSGSVVDVDGGASLG
jgi:NAD(P)-dependent dehydrogenase (short-subunit alcohol dehydrogenase family)